MSPSWLVVNLLINLNVKSIVTSDLIRASFTVVEVGEWTIVVRVSAVVSPPWLVAGLDIEAVVLGDRVWAGFSMIEVVSWTVVIRVSRVVAPFWLVLLILVVLVMVLACKSDSLRRGQEHGHCEGILHHV